MKHRVFYDSGHGFAALIAAGIRLNLLRGDVLPSAERGWQRSCAIMANG
jgi:hypothetical protein